MKKLNQSKIVDIMELCETLQKNQGNPSIEKIIYQNYLSHLRAMYIESDRKELRKNITLQNYFRVNRYEILAEYINKIFDVEVEPGIKFRYVIRETVDKYIAHYDKPNDETQNMFLLCESLIGIAGKIPLLVFMKKMLSCTMLCFIIIGYISGEFAVTNDYIDNEKYTELVGELNYLVNEIVGKLSYENNQNL